MTSRRARAYARVTMTLDNVGPTKLLGPEQAQIRHAADTLLFCADIPNDASARAEFAGAEALLDHLVAYGRWEPRAGRRPRRRRLGLRARAGRLPSPGRVIALRSPLDVGRIRPAALFDAWLFAEADATLALAAWRSRRATTRPPPTCSSSGPGP